YKPTYMDFVMNIKRQAQIIYPKDAAAMLMWCDIAPNQHILESGIGQGALSLALLRALAGTGSLTSYEIRADFAEQSAKFIKQFMGYSPENHNIEVRSIYDGIDGVYDRVLLDLPEPWQVVPHLKNSLKNGGLIVAYLPTILQVKSYVDALKVSGLFSDIETAEFTRRPWKVDGMSVRPEMWIYNHSAFLISARKLKSKQE
ncbi:MAG: tRNA (adenine-N1)-methyltransferase, partial [Mucispirillum sp.]|nr:tRNA (adenine-N1)-methyltransferase [Mucispirillum sp.]